MLKKLHAMVIGVLLTASLFSTYSWYRTERELEVLKAIHEETWTRVYFVVHQDLFELSYMSRAFGDLLECNASEKELIEYAEHYYLRARHLEKVFWLLEYELRDESHKYYKLGKAFGTLEEFFLNLYSNIDVDKIETVYQNLETLKEVSSLLKTLNEYTNPREIPPELADELLNVTNKLKLVHTQGMEK